MKLTKKQCCDIMMFLVATVAGLINTPFGIALGAYFLMLQLREDDDD
jgi:hypothetical protein